VSTAAPAAHAARLVCRGELHATGVLPPEQALEPETFLAALSHTGCEVRVGKESAETAQKHP
jgi:saccharopine dehydrogenase-like NADP-dependent oxidoreductase